MTNSSRPNVGSDRLVVCLFSGGRGSATITRELLRRNDVELHMMINAYDDGLSTGALRDFIPGMLGPSDFRKNLSYLMDLYSEGQFALENVLEYRLPKAMTQEQLKQLQAIASPRVSSGSSLPQLASAFDRIDPEVREALAEYLRVFFDLYSKNSQFDFNDCSLGNLFFAGAYLKVGRNFNKATAELAKLFGSRASLINVTQGENRILVALKDDGEILEREVRIVSAQSESRIIDLFLLSAPLDPAPLAKLSLEEKRAALRALEAPVDLSPEAKDALLRSDIIIYGPGTQFSSLLPSYRTQGMRDALRASRARVKAQVLNLDWDHDIRGLKATDLIDNALYYMGDESNHDRLITHAFVAEHVTSRPSAVPMPSAEEQTYKGVRLVRGAFENPAKPGTHSGLGIVRSAMDLYERELHFGKRELDIYIDLNERSMALPFLLQEFLEVPWNRIFSKVRLTLNHVSTPNIELPPYLEILVSERDRVFSDVDIFAKWHGSGSSAYLVTISGDGEYRLSEAFDALELLERTSFGAAFGSRNQSRRQFMRSLSSAYGEGQILYYVSWLGALAVTAAFGARHQVIFSDPLTGFRVYKRSVIAAALPRDSVDPKEISGAMGITKVLVNHDVEIAEVPVSYRTYKGFTNVRWRLSRGIRNVWSAF